MHFFLLFLAMLISFMATPAAGALGCKWGAVDHPGDRKVHRSSVPRLGGMAIFSGFFLSCAFYVYFIAPASSGWIPEGTIALLIAAILIVFALGIFDDFRGTNAPVKFSVQLIAALLVIWNGDVIRTVTNPAGGSIELGILAVPVTILWLVGVTNAFNLIDGVDGVAAGVGAIVAGTMALIGVYSSPLQPCAGRCWDSSASTSTRPGFSWAIRAPCSSGSPSRCSRSGPAS